MANFIEVVSYDPRWPRMFEEEAGPLKKALGDACLEIHHIGSTAVPGLSAKPKIDILVVVPGFADIDTAALENIGFSGKGEIIPTGRYFSKKQPKVHLHAFEQGNPVIARDLQFRDWLRTHAEDREAYALLKKDLARKHTDGMRYCHDKTEFINGIISKAK